MGTLGSLVVCGAEQSRRLRELKALGLWSDKEASMHGEIDITQEQLRMIPALVRDSVDTEFQKVLAPRPDEVDDAEVRRFLREDFPGIVDLAILHPHPE